MKIKVGKFTVASVDSFEFINGVKKWHKEYFLIAFGKMFTFKAY